MEIWSKGVPFMSWHMQLIRLDQVLYNSLELRFHLPRKLSVWPQQSINQPTAVHTAHSLNLHNNLSVANSSLNCKHMESVQNLTRAQSNGDVQEDKGAVKSAQWS
jgi:hypothetical protein